MVAEVVCRVWCLTIYPYYQEAERKVRGLILEQLHVNTANLDADNKPSQFRSQHSWVASLHTDPSYSLANWDPYLCKYIWLVPGQLSINQFYSNTVAMTETTSPSGDIIFPLMHTQSERCWISPICCAHGYPNKSVDSDCLPVLFLHTVCEPFHVISAWVAECSLLPIQPPPFPLGFSSWIL